MNKTKRVKEVRRAAAEKRQAAYDALPIEDKLRKAGAKERKKLLEKQDV